MLYLQENENTKTESKLTNSQIKIFTSAKNAFFSKLKTWTGNSFGIVITCRWDELFNFTLDDVKQTNVS